MSTLACSPASSGGGGGSNNTGGSPSGGNTVQPNGGTTNQPNGGTTVQPSGGNTVQPNGGTTNQPNGGTTVQPSGGNTGNPAGNTGNPAGNTGNPAGNTGNPAGNTGNPGGTISNTGGAKTGGTTGNPGGTTSPGGSTGNPGGTTANTGGAKTGGTTTASGGTTTAGGGSTATSGACPAGPAVISDFESGKGDMLKQGTPARSGWWYVYYPGSPSSAVKSGQTQTPAVNTAGPIAVAAAPDTSSCNKYALHTTGTGFVGSAQDYAGLGAGFLPKDATGQIFNPYDVSAGGYTGVKFKIKTGGGTAPAVYFEVLTQDTMSSAQGGLLGAEGNANDVPVGLHNNRGLLLNDPWIPGGITSTYKTIYVPFGSLVSRWVPAPATSSGAACVAGGPKCQAPAFVPGHVMGIQFSFYSGDSAKGFPVVGTPGTYDIWVDDVEFTTDDAGLQAQWPRAGFPLTTGVGVGSCIKPKGPSADAKFLVPAYNQWKATFVKNGKVIRPENANDTVSEGIAYAMMIAVAFNDQTLFDSVYGTWKANATAGSLMTWCLGSGGGTGTPCPSTGGSATDADEDAAYALLMAGKLWGGTYNASAVTMIGDIWSKDIDSGTKLPKGGSNYAAPTGTSGQAITNASYFAPSMYRAFAAVDSGHDWAGVATASLNAVNGAISGSNGLIPAWCGNSCTAAASNGAPTDVDYQYDSHRIPMRIGLDYCYNGTAAAKTYTTKNTAFFAAAAANGIAYIQDMYTPSGGPVSNTAPNSASIIGTAGVGAMATGNQAFLDTAYQAVFDTITRGSMAPVDAAGKTPYSYFNATVGLLTALMMTGAFPH
jgi:endo-1,4-beta-D-glucanase Y